MRGEFNCRSEALERGKIQMAGLPLKGAENVIKK